MKKNSQHNSVSEMVQALSDDQTFADEFAKRVSDRQLIKVLTVLRTQAGLSQKELAAKLNCTQSKVSKLESGCDADLGFGDVIDYTQAVEHEMRIFLVPKGQRIVDDVKMHAFIIKRLLDRLVQMVGHDGVMIKAAADFLGETAFNLTRYVQSSAAGLPALPEGPAHPLQVEAPEIEEDDSSRNERCDASADKSSGSLALP
jgi:predicted XRE-type DNA-binding protein